MKKSKKFTYLPPKKIELNISTQSYRISSKIKCHLPVCSNFLTSVCQDKKFEATEKITKMEATLKYVLVLYNLSIHSHYMIQIKWVMF